MNTSESSCKVIRLSQLSLKRKSRLWKTHKVTERHNLFSRWLSPRKNIKKQFLFYSRHCERAVIFTWTSINPSSKEIFQNLDQLSTLLATVRWIKMQEFSPQTKVIHNERISRKTSRAYWTLNRHGNWGWEPVFISIGVRSSVWRHLPIKTGSTRGMNSSQTPHLLQVCSVSNHGPAQTESHLQHLLKSSWVEGIVPSFK